MEIAGASASLCCRRAAGSNHNGRYGEKTVRGRFRALTTVVMPALSRPQDGVLSHAYVAGIHVFECAKSKAWMAGTSPAMTGECLVFTPQFPDDGDG